MSKNSDMMSVIAYLQIKNSFKHFADWLLFAKWLGVFKPLPQEKLKHSLSTDLIVEVVNAMMTDKVTTLRRMYETTNLLQAIADYLTEEQQRNLLHLLRNLDNDFLEKEV